MSLAVIAIVASATAALSVGSQIYSGVSQKNAADDSASLLQEQARIEREETGAEVERRSEERNKFIARQKVAFLANGVGLAGTPLIVLEDSFNQFNTEIASVKRAGAARAGLLDREAKIKKKSGRAAMIGGVIGAGSTIANNVTRSTQIKSTQIES